VGGVVADHLLIQLSSCQSVPEIFANKVERCQKLHQILYVFVLPNFRRQAFQKLYPIYHVCLAAHCVEVSWVTPTSPKVLGMHMMNFKPNFTCSPIKFWGTPSPFGICVSKPWSLLALVKIWGATPLRGINLVSRKCPFRWAQTHIPYFDRSHTLLWQKWFKWSWQLLTIANELSQDGRILNF